MKQTKLKSAFTLVETLVVIAVMAIILPTLFSILFLIMRQQIKIYRLSEVKRQGDSIVTLLDNTIRNNAYRIYNSSGVQICTTPGTTTSAEPMTFGNSFDSRFTIDWSDPNITITQGAIIPPAPTFAFPAGQLNNTKVRISSFSISCSRGANLFSGPLINLSFSICFLSGAACATGVDQASLNYQTSIKLRNFPTQ